MKVDVHQHGSVSVLVPRGAITENEIEDIDRTLLPESKKSGARMVIDMSNVPYLDSAGIEYLLKIAAAAPTAGSRPRVAGMTDTVRETLDLTDTLKRFNRFDSVESAVRSYM